ncbi:MAG: sugar kinase, partial [Brevinema sp.]
AAYGDAYLAACLFNPDIDLHDWVGVGRYIRPCDDHKALYQERYMLYKKLYQSTRSLIME